MIAMCCHDSEENERSEYTYQTLYSLRRTVDLHKHRLFVIDNNSCRRTKEMLEVMSKERHHKFTVITMPENVGTAGAINQAWKHKRTGENLIKLDYNCDVFQTIAFCPESDFNIVGFEDAVYNNITDTMPTFIHGNGHTPMTEYYKLI